MAKDGEIGSHHPARLCWIREAAYTTAFPQVTRDAAGLTIKKRRDASPFSSWYKASAAALAVNLPIRSILRVN
jgi:hypothetical protein